MVTIPPFMKRGPSGMGGGGGIKFFFKGNPIPKATEQLSFAILFTKDSLTYTYLPLES